MATDPGKAPEPKNRDERPASDLWVARVFDDQESSRLGTGWLSGTASVFLGALGLLSVARALVSRVAQHRSFPGALPAADRPRARSRP